MALEVNNVCCDRRPADALPTGETRCGSIDIPAGAKTSILFVDDEPAMLRVLKMGMRSMMGAWDMDFANSGEEAVLLVNQKKFDVVITDMRMPGMNGAQLLNHVLRRHPQTIRIILSGYSDLSEVVNCVGLTHQFLEKPCSLDDLKECLKRVTLVKNRLTNEKICNLAGSLKNLPSIPELYIEIAEALQSPCADVQGIGDIASRDPALSAKMLQLANSAFFGFGRKVYSVSEAVQLLGVTVIQSLALAAPIFSSFSRGRCAGFPLDQIWEHSIQTGVLAQRISNQKLNDSYLAEQAFCSGVLHDVGKIILADGLPEEYAAVRNEAAATHTPILEIERKHFSVTHAEVGGYLLAIWGLPIPLVEAVGNHHCPRRCGGQELCLAGIVHIASALRNCHHQFPGTVHSPVDVDYLKLIGLEHQFETWRQELAETR